MYKHCTMRDRQDKSNRLYQEQLHFVKALSRTITVVKALSRTHYICKISQLFRQDFSIWLMI